MPTESPIDALLLDMDGVLYHGDAPLPGAASFLNRIAHIPHLFVTNNPIRPPRQVAERFEAIGLPRPALKQVLTSAAATAAWLAAERPGYRFFAVGADGLHQVLRAAGGREDRERADFVVVGEGPGIDFDSLSTGIDLIVKRGARLVVTNPDTSVDDHHDGRHRVLPGAGALVAPFALASAVKPVVIGKPEPALFQMALERLGSWFEVRLGHRQTIRAERCVMVGDRPDTDIAGAVRYGIRAALVRTGRFAPGEAWPDGLPRPHWDCDNLDALATKLAPLLPQRC